jgi:hypothetical protein
MREARVRLQCDFFGQAFFQPRIAQQLRMPAAQAAAGDGGQDRGEDLGRQSALRAGLERPHPQQQQEAGPGHLGGGGIQHCGGRRYA